MQTLDNMENRNPRGAGRKKLPGRRREIIATDEELLEIKKLLKEIRSEVKKVQKNN